MKKQTSLDTAKVSAIALKLVAKKGFAHVTLDAVAKEAKIPVDKLKAIYPNMTKLVPMIANEIDHEAFETLGKVSGSPHDILFEHLMARFDILQKHRGAILNMAETARYDKSLARALACSTMEGVYRIINSSKISDPPRPILAAGITSIYGWAFWIWRKDQSSDMAKTMAALDRALRLAAKALGLLKRRL